MSTLVEKAASAARAESPPDPDRSKQLLERIRGEFLEMPGLSLTLAQAARVFGIDIRESKRLLQKLLDEGFLLRDARGAYRRRDVPGAGGDGPGRVSRGSTSDVHHEAASGRRSPGEARSPGDLLEAIGIELPCLGCDEPYRIPLRTIRLSQSMMEDGCRVRHFADCPPAAFAHLINPAVLAEFEKAVERVELAAAGAGGRLVGPR